MINSGMCSRLYIHCKHASDAGDGPLALVGEVPAHAWLARDLLVALDLPSAALDARTRHTLRRPDALFVHC